MELGSFATRFDRWGRTPALALLAALIAVLILAGWPAASIPQPKMRAAVTEQSDLDLYRATIRRVGAGEAYYPVAADELRKGGYPLQPFVTFRLPTLALVYAHVPELLMSAIEGVRSRTHRRRHGVWICIPCWGPMLCRWLSSRS